MERAEGLLFKLSGFMIRTWEQRWVIVERDTLVYYRQRPGTEEEPRKSFGKFDRLYGSIN